VQIAEHFATEQRSRALRWLCWLPLACLLGIELYVPVPVSAAFLFTMVSAVPIAWLGVRRFFL
jgi:hypothetical protein